MLEFSYRPQVFNGFFRGEGSDETLIKWDKDVDVLVAISSPPHLVGKSVVKLRPSEQQSRGDMKNNIHKD